MSEKYKFGNPEGIYFVTLTVVHWIDVFIRSNHKQIIIDGISTRYISLNARYSVVKLLGSLPKDYIHKIDAAIKVHLDID